MPKQKRLNSNIYYYCLAIFFKDALIFSLKSQTTLCFISAILFFFPLTSYGMYGTIAATVSNEQGEGITGATVIVVKLSGEGDYVAMIGTTNGFVTWDRILPGSYKVKILARDVGYKDEWYRDKKTFADADIIEISEGKTTHINCALEKLDSGTINGKVVDLSGNPIAFIVLSLYDSNYLMIIEMTTDASGNFFMNGLSDGAYKIKARHPGQCYREIWYKDKSDFSNADSIVIQNGTGVSNLSIRIAATSNCGASILPGEVQTHFPDEKNPWYWFSYIPPNLNKTDLGNILVTMHAQSHNYWEIVESQLSLMHYTVEKANEMKLIRLGLAVPRSKEPDIGVGGFDYKCFDTSIDPFYQRPDIYLNYMIDTLINKLVAAGYNVEHKIFIDGFSVGAQFAYVYSLLHPERVKAIAAGGYSHLVIPKSLYKGTILDYPLGVNNFFNLTGSHFNRKAFMKVPKFIYHGEQDYNDNVTYGAGWPLSSMVDFLNTTFGNTAPVRMENMVNYLIQLGCSIEFKKYPNVGHEWNNSEMRKGVDSFFLKHINRASKKAKSANWLMLLFNE